jgi:hypothetical protein
MIMFDPNLGELKDAQIIMNLTTFQDVKALNDENNSANATFYLGGKLSLALPDKMVLYVEAENNMTNKLDPGKDLALNKSASRTEEFSLDESQARWLVASFPNETIELPLASAFFGSSKTDSGLSLKIAYKSVSSVCVVYNYLGNGGEKSVLVDKGASVSTEEG